MYVKISKKFEGQGLINRIEQNLIITMCIQFYKYMVVLTNSEHIIYKNLCFNRYLRNSNK